MTSRFQERGAPPMSCPLAVEVTPSMAPTHSVDFCDTVREGFVYLTTLGHAPLSSKEWSRPTTRGARAPGRFSGVFHPFLRMPQQY